MSWRMNRQVLCLSIVLVTMCFGGNLSAFGCCNDPCPCQGPLEECHIRVGVRGGVSPTWYTDKTKNLLIGQTGENGIVGTSTVPDFDKQFKTPWTIGAHVGYNFTDRVELFLDGEYTQGTGDTYKFTADPFAVSQKFSDYTEWSLYVGGRYYFCSWDVCCSQLSPFIGGKLGFRRYQDINFKEDLVGPVEINFGTRDFYESYTVPSLGGQVGVELFLNRCFSVSLMAEFIYSGQLRSEYESINGGVGVQAVSIGDTGPLFSIPVTIGVNFTL